MTLEKWQEHFRQLYGRRNDCFAWSTSARLGRLLADVFGWTMALANSFSRLPLHEVFSSSGARTVALIAAIGASFSSDSVSVSVSHSYS